MNALIAMFASRAQILDFDLDTWKHPYQKEAHYEMASKGDF